MLGSPTGVQDEKQKEKASIYLKIKSKASNDDEYSEESDEEFSIDG